MPKRSSFALAIQATLRPGLEPISLIAAPSREMSRCSSSRGAPPTSAPSQMALLGGIVCGSRREFACRALEMTSCGAGRISTLSSHSRSAPPSGGTQSGRQFPVGAPNCCDWRRSRADLYPTPISRNINGKSGQTRQHLDEKSCAWRAPARHLANGAIDSLFKFHTIDSDWSGEGRRDHEQSARPRNGNLSAVSWLYRISARHSPGSRAQDARRPALGFESEGAPSAEFSGKLVRLRPGEDDKYHPTARWHDDNRLRRRDAARNSIKRAAF